MRTSVRTVGILIAGVAGFLIWGATGASADVPSITDPYKITNSSLPAQNSQPSAPAESPPPAAADPEPAPQEGAAPVEPAPVDPAPGPVGAVEPVADEVHPATGASLGAATPAPEQVMTISSRSPAAAAAADAAPAATLNLPGRATQTIKKGWHGFSSFLAETIGACAVGAASGAGGPALLVLAVIGMAPMFTRHWASRAWSVGDEDAREFLYAWDVIAPG